MHINPRKVLLSCVATAGTGLWLAEAQKVVEGGIAALYGTSKRGPWQEEVSDFDNLLQRPNATGDFPIPGPNISSNSTAFSTSEGWSWSISVVADLPIPTSVAHEGEEFYTGGKLVFNAPSLPANDSSTFGDAIDDNWMICLYEWSLWSAAYPAGLRSDNGTCLSVLSPECVAAMEQEAASKHTSRGCRCPIAREIPECAVLGDDAEVFSSTCAAGPFNASALWASGADSLKERAFGDAYGRGRGNTTSYNHIGSLAWPVMASFRNLRTGDLATAKLSCPRAETATEGSIAPTGEGLDEGDGQGQEGDDRQNDQQGGGGRINANWLILAGLFLVSVLIV